MTMFPHDWCVCDVERGWWICQIENRFNDPGDGVVYQSANITILKYAGKVPSEEDVYNPANFAPAVKNSDGGEEGAHRRAGLIPHGVDRVTSADRRAPDEPGAGVVRTPDERFAGIAGYPFEPNYVTVDAPGATPRMHYVDAGPWHGPVVLLVHGQPTWSYLYRTVIPVLTARGLRVAAAEQHRVRTVGQAHRTDPLHLSPPRPVDDQPGREPRSARHHARRPGLGWAHRPGHPGSGEGALRPGGGHEHRPAQLRPDARRQAHLGQPRHRYGRVVLEESLVEYVQYCQRAPELVAGIFRTRRRARSPPRCSPPTTPRFPTSPSPPACGNYRAIPPHPQRPRERPLPGHAGRTMGAALPDRLLRR